MSSCIKTLVSKKAAEQQGHLREQGRGQAHTATGTSPGASVKFICRRVEENKFPQQCGPVSTPNKVPEFRLRAPGALSPTTENQPLPSCAGHIPGPAAQATTCGRVTWLLSGCRREERPKRSPADCSGKLYTKSSFHKEKQRRTSIQI